MEFIKKYQFFLYKYLPRNKLVVNPTTFVIFFFSHGTKQYWKHLEDPKLNLIYVWKKNQFRAKAPYFFTVWDNKLNFNAIGLIYIMRKEIRKSSLLSYIRIDTSICVQEVLPVHYRYRLLYKKIYLFSVQGTICRESIIN